MMTEIRLGIKSRKQEQKNHIYPNLFNTVEEDLLNLILKSLMGLRFMWRDKTPLKETKMYKSEYMAIQNIATMLTCEERCLTHENSISVYVTSHQIIICLLPD
ncbi:hypothetical protein TNCT_187791 [Trichonephila clavata]|uniref:Uncharacterized protein n=1 Tax=Trichonephila clavata TaxID=2740835 RepID=A0A8X6JCF2_TRICU|nr:hypothetical protein TNCT_187791 [Trichonephila clavata]